MTIISSRKLKSSLQGDSSSEYQWILTGARQIYKHTERYTSKQFLFHLFVSAIFNYFKEVINNLPCGWKSVTQSKFTLNVPLFRVQNSKIKIYNYLDTCQPLVSLFDIPIGTHVAMIFRFFRGMDLVGNEVGTTEKSATSKNLYPQYWLRASTPSVRNV